MSERFLEDAPIYLVSNLFHLADRYFVISIKKIDD